MDSTNGTNVNGFHILPNQPYKLREGDRIDLGQMHLTLHIAAAPGQ
jgi:predicted component of type VI protein secretion system